MGYNGPAPKWVVPPKAMPPAPPKKYGRGSADGVARDILATIENDDDVAKSRLRELALSGMSAIRPARPSGPPTGRAPNPPPGPRRWQPNEDKAAPLVTQCEGCGHRGGERVCQYCGCRRR